MDAQSIIAFLALGAFAGFMAGLLGIGGGGIMVPVLTAIFLRQGIPTDQVVIIALGTSMASMIITSFSSFRAHHANGNVHWQVVKSMAPGILCGTFAATFIASLLSSVVLAIFFAIFMAFVALQMFINSKPAPSRKLMGKTGLFSAGSFIGAISALVSIGGGSMTVPFLLWQNIDIKKAIGTSAAIGFPIAIAGTLGYIINGLNAGVSTGGITIGFVNIGAVAIISITSFLCAPMGAKVANSLPVAILKRIFALLLIMLSLKMLFSVV